MPADAAAHDVDVIEQRLALDPRSRILDVPFGSGRHTIARRGHHVVGADMSTEATAAW